MSPTKRAEALLAAVEAAGGSYLAVRTDGWRRVKRRDGTTVGEIGDQPTRTRLNYKGVEVNPQLRALVRRNELVYATPPEARPEWPGGGFVVTDQTLAVHCAVLSTIVGGASPGRRETQRAYQLSAKQERFARARARERARITDVRQALAAELVAAGEWQPADAVDSELRSEALDRAVRKVIRDERRAMAAEQTESDAVADILSGRSDFEISVRVVAERNTSAGSGEGFEYAAETYRYRTHKQVITASRKEEALVRQFKQYLASKGRRAEEKRLAAGTTEIEWDVYNPDERILFEAKADPTDRFQLRMAIGQLFDYAYFGFSAEERRTLRLAVLLPSVPSRELSGLLASLGIGAAWAERESFREAIPAC